MATCGNGQNNLCNANRDPFQMAPAVTAAVHWSQTQLTVEYLVFFSQKEGHVKMYEGGTRNDPLYLLHQKLHSIRLNLQREVN